MRERASARTSRTVPLSDLPAAMERARAEARDSGYRSCGRSQRLTGGAPNWFVARAPRCVSGFRVVSRLPAAVSGRGGSAGSTGTGRFAQVVPVPPSATPNTNRSRPVGPAPVPGIAIVAGSGGNSLDGYARELTERLGARAIFAPGSTGSFGHR